MQCPSHSLAQARDGIDIPHWVQDVVDGEGRVCIERCLGPPRGVEQGFPQQIGEGEDRAYIGVIVKRRDSRWQPTQVAACR